MLSRSEINMATWCEMFRKCYPIPFTTLAQAEDGANKLRAEQVVYDDASDAQGPRYFVFVARNLGV